MSSVSTVAGSGKDLASQSVCSTETRCERLPVQKSWKPWIRAYHATSDLLKYPYPGRGTQEDPFVIDFLPGDVENPLNWSHAYKWFVSMLVSIALFAISFDSSAYAGGLKGIMEEFGVSIEVATAGISLVLLGFGLGPLLWSPQSEVFGRRQTYVVTYGATVCFLAGSAGAQNIETLLLMRFFTGAFGASPLVNAAGVVGDVFEESKRGIAFSYFAAAPFAGPVVAQIVGSWVGQIEGWRWVMGVMCIFTSVMWIIGCLFVPETYPPVLLRARANKMTKESESLYISRYDAAKRLDLKALYKVALLRPWVMLFTEPIVTLLSVYTAIVYGVLYLFFTAMPIVFHQDRGWSQGITGLSYIGITIGIFCAILYSVWDDKRYQRCIARAALTTLPGQKPRAPPESRLPPGMIGSVMMPIGLFIFAFTNRKEIHWIVPISATALFGWAEVAVFQCSQTYLVDSYGLYSSSVLAGSTLLRSLVGAAFPLFGTKLYTALGNQWASSIPAFLALACAPFMFVFYKKGPEIRRRCKYTAEADRVFHESFKADLSGVPDLQRKRTRDEMHELHRVVSVV
ncbi:bicyclomycin resistance protein [Protomyces lactucae-debilis]|uniref:Bicyclomycin resistance protein n=1 Tax=Protomyces lactucae-debilis TaxID=2754530 RepID=A0A1Y2FK14_PROLT|nr:bicyclomycin resistance protein [Protomyces lactucae-debilis]ORY83714.1 bicyclomycin resistance protein [Protomyces lactucae-debilis]